MSLTVAHLVPHLPPMPRPRTYIIAVLGFGGYRAQR
jgi:hypothetical protein